jgi:hypothetical protein
MEKNGDFANFGQKDYSQNKDRSTTMTILNQKRKSDKPLTREGRLLKEKERLRCENVQKS